MKGITASFNYSLSQCLAKKNVHAVAFSMITGICIGEKRKLSESWDERFAKRIPIVKAHR